jgi:hypothetical protein
LSPARALAFLLALAALAAPPARAHTDPASVAMTLYRLAVSRSELCTEPIVVFDSSEKAREAALAEEPVLGSGTVPNGVYPCVIVELSDRVRVRPKPSDEGTVCDPGKEYEVDICGPGWKLRSRRLDGSEVDCDPSPQRIAVYFSTASSLASNRGLGMGGFDFYRPPESKEDKKGIRLEKPIRLGRDGTALLAIDLRNRIAGDSGTCIADPPEFSLRFPARGWLGLF